jgi:hypothetical protein
VTLGHLLQRIDLACTQHSTQQQSTPAAAYKATRLWVATTVVVGVVSVTQPLC